MSLRWLVTLGCLLAGCGATGGQWAYFLTSGKGKKIPAEFTLTSEPVLILIDDPGQLLDYPPAQGIIFDELAQDLLRNKGAAKIVPPETLAGIRQSTPDFDKLSAREVGERAKAAQVLWVMVEDAYLPVEVSAADQAVYIAVSVKVLDANQKEDRNQVRLFPAEGEGRLVTARTTGSDMDRLKTRDAVVRDVCAKLGHGVGRLFYEHRADDLGHEE